MFATCKVRGIKIMFSTNKKRRVRITNPLKVLKTTSAIQFPIPGFANSHEKKKRRAAR